MKQYFNSDEEFNKTIAGVKEKTTSLTSSDVFRSFLNIRPKIIDECYWQLEKYDEEFSSYISNHLSNAISFIKNDCTANEFSWMSEVWDDITEKTKSKEFVDCLKETAKKFPEECKKFNIAGSIESAEGYL